MTDKEHWKDYEIQKADGSWTTVSQILEEQAKDILRDVNVIFDNVDNLNLQYQMDRLEDKYTQNTDKE